MNKPSLCLSPRNGEATHRRAAPTVYRIVRLSMVSIAGAFSLALAMHAEHSRSPGPVTEFDAVADGTSTSQWVWQNPVPTGNYLTGVDFTDSNNGTLVGIAGTIMHTSDGGLSWTIQSSGTTETLQ